MGQIAEGLLSLSGWAALACLFVLPALEAPAFLGLVLPGEVALALAGAVVVAAAVTWTCRRAGGSRAAARARGAASSAPPPR